MDSVWEGIDGLDADVIVADSRGGRQATDLFKIAIPEIGELKTEAVRAAVLVIESLFNVENGRFKEKKGVSQQGGLYFFFNTAQGCNLSGCVCTSSRVLRTASFCQSGMSSVSSSTISMACSFCRCSIREAA